MDFTILAGNENHHRGDCSPTRSLVPPTDVVSASRSRRAGGAAADVNSQNL